MIETAALARENAEARGPRSAANIVDAALNKPMSMSHPTPRLTGLGDDASSRLHALVEQMLANARVSPAAVAFEVRSQLGIRPLIATSLATLQSDEFHKAMASLHNAPQAVSHHPNNSAALIMALDETPAYDARLVIESIIAVPAFENRGYEAELLNAVSSYADQRNMAIVVLSEGMASKYNALLGEFVKQPDGSLLRDKREPHGTYDPSRARCRKPQ